MLFAAQVLLVGPATGATSTTTISFNVAGFVSTTNTCTDPSATVLGSIQPGSVALTDTGAGACRMGFSSNQTSMLRAAQPDGTGTAMASVNANASEIQASNIYWDVDFANASIGWIVGSNGEIEKTIDGGASWANQKTGGNTLRGVHAVSTMIAVAVGESGEIQRTVNGGTNWAPVASGVGDRLEAVHGSGATLWAVGRNQNILKSTDSGANWTPVVHAFTQNMYDVSVASSTVAYIAAGNCEIYKTSDGTNWALSHDCGGDWLRQIDALDTNNVSTVGQSSLVCTTNDGGATAWACTYENFQQRLGGVSMRSVNDIVMVGRRGQTQRSTDGGASYTQTWMPSNSSMYGMDRASATVLVAVGAGQTIMRSTDDGVTFNVVSQSSTAFAGVAWTDPGSAIIVGDQGDIQTTADHGTTLTPRASSVSEALEDVSFGGGTQAAAVGRSGRALYSNDSGATWSPAVTGTAEHLFNVSMADELNGWAVGDNGTILHTTDGGQNWAADVSGTTELLFGVDAVDDQIAWATGANNVTRRTIDGGATWTNVNNASGDTYQVLAVSDQEAYITNGWQSVRHTTDGGSTWSAGPAANSLDTENMAITGTGIVQSGGPANMKLSLDGGATWIGSNGSDHQVYDMAADDLNGIMLVGGGGRIWRSTAGSPIDDYVFAGPANWAGGSGQSLFAACLQNLTGASAVADWTVDAAGTANQCEANDTDPWNAIPTTWSKIAHTTVPGAAGDATVVFGARPASASPAGEYLATVVFEVAAPNI